MKTYARYFLGTLTASLLCNIAFAGAASSVKESTPQNMTCREYMDLNPKALTPVASWIVNKDIDYKGGDYVDMHEVETVTVPILLKICDEQPESKLEQWIDKLK